MAATKRNAGLTSAVPRATLNDEDLVCKKTERKYSVHHIQITHANSKTKILTINMEGNTKHERCTGTNGCIYNNLLPRLSVKIKKNSYKEEMAPHFPYMRVFFLFKAVNI